MAQIIGITVLLLGLAACTGISRLLGQSQQAPSSNTTVVVPPAADNSGLYVILTILVIAVCVGVWLVARRQPATQPEPVSDDVVKRLAAAVAQELTQPRPTVMTADQYRALEAAYDTQRRNVR